MKLKIWMLTVLLLLVLTRGANAAELPTADAPGSGQAAETVPLAAGEGRIRGTGLMSVYGMIVKQSIKKHWRPPVSCEETDLSVTLDVQIDQAGKILSSKVVTPSSKSDYVDSTMRAVAETETLPPPRVKTLDTLRITFNLQELRK
jgi:colicin import membrane protein